MDSLNNEDIGVLIEALDAWVSRKQSGELMGDMLLAVFAPKDDTDAMTKMKREREERHRQAELEKRIEQDTATLLKAKLIGMRQRAVLRGLGQSQDNATAQISKD